MEIRPPARNAWTRWGGPWIMVACGLAWLACADPRKGIITEPGGGNGPTPTPIGPARTPVSFTPVPIGPGGPTPPGGPGATATPGPGTTQTPIFVSSPTPVPPTAVPPTAGPTSPPPPPTPTP